MKINRSVTTHWASSGKDDTGMVSTQNTALSQPQYSFKTEFVDGIGTNPEELLAADCFSMKLAFNLQEIGFTASSTNTQAITTFEDKEIPHFQLLIYASVPGLAQKPCDRLADHAKQNYPISRTLNTSFR